MPASSALSVSVCCLSVPARWSCVRVSVALAVGVSAATRCGCCSDAGLTASCLLPERPLRHPLGLEPPSRPWVSCCPSTWGCQCQLGKQPPLWLSKRWLPSRLSYTFTSIPSIGTFSQVPTGPSSPCFPARRCVGSRSLSSCLLPWATLSTSVVPRSSQQRGRRGVRHAGDS